MSAIKSHKPKLVVIGNGMAGARTIEEILTCGGGAQFEIAVFGEEPHENYNRVLLSSVLNGSRAPAEIVLNGRDWYAENGVALHTGMRVDAIARPHKAIHCDDGNWYQYDKLIIASGSRPAIPPIAALRKPDGRLRPGVFVFRTLDDCKQIAEYAAKSQRAVVIGGGLLGLEAARGLLNHRVEVHVIHLLGHLMEQQLDQQAGAILKRAIEKLGIRVHLNKATKTILGDDHVAGLAFAEGPPIYCDLVVIATGITPNAEIGAHWGLTAERGIVVDDQLRTSDPDIYAVGECAQHRGRVYGLVEPLWEQAKVLADHITGRNPATAYTGSTIATRLKVMGVELASMGRISADDETDEIVQYMESRRGLYQKLIIRDGRLVGAILIGDTSKAAYLMRVLDRGTPLPDEQLSLLRDGVAPSRKVAFDDMPDDARICNCNGVDKGTIIRCVAGGTRSAAGVISTTRAGTGCGSCLPLVTELVEWARGSAEQEPSLDSHTPSIALAKLQLLDSALDGKLNSAAAVSNTLADGKDAG
jgi:nitrite reductase (NADH) large subunit